MSNIDAIAKKVYATRKLENWDGRDVLVLRLGRQTSSIDLSKKPASTSLDDYVSEKLYHIVKKKASHLSIDDTGEVVEVAPEPTPISLPDEKTVETKISALIKKVL